MEHVVAPFYITFGVQFSRGPNGDPHPLGLYSDGYAVIEAPEIDTARKIARAIFGDAWAMIRDEEEFIEGGIAARWHHAGELLRIRWEWA